MKAALRTLVELDAEGKRIAVLGEMRELGTNRNAGTGRLVRPQRRSGWIN
jgi:UDP-N-acetylmuramyl pentapeptide synthase